jgi:broad specificity phosphatase PhoE
MNTVKPIFVLLRHVPTMDDSLGLLTSPNAKTQILPLEAEAFVRIATVIDSIAAESGREVRISASPTDRGSATANALSAQLNCPHTLAEDRRLLNIDQGVVAGQSQKEFAESPLYWRWHHFPDTVLFPKGENLTDVASRIDAFISEQCSSNLVHVVISHTTPLQVIATRLLGLELSTVWRFYFAHYHLTVIYGATLISSNSLAEPGSWTTYLRE